MSRATSAHPHPARRSEADGEEAAMTLLTELDPDVAYPPTPGVPESGLHALVRYLTYGALREHFAGHKGCFVGQDRNIYYRRGDNRTFVSPDVFVCFGVDPADWELAGSYRPWDAGAPPAFVLEIASERTYKTDLYDKPAIYLEIGVEEYWRIDATGGDFYTPFLQGDRRVGDSWQPIDVGLDDDDRLRGRSTVLGLDLCAEPHRLRLCDPQTGRRLSDPDDVRRQRDDLLASRDAAAARAAAAEAELAALKARLGDPTQQ